MILCTKKYHYLFAFIILLNLFSSPQEAFGFWPALGEALLHSFIYDGVKYTSGKIYNYCTVGGKKGTCSQDDLDSLKKNSSIIEEIENNTRHGKALSPEDAENIKNSIYEIKQIAVHIDSNNTDTLRKIEILQQEFDKLKRKKTLKVKVKQKKSSVQSRSAKNSPPRHYSSYPHTQGFISHQQPSIQFQAPSTFSPPRISLPAIQFQAPSTFSPPNIQLQTPFAFSSPRISLPTIQFQAPSTFSPPPSYFSGHRRHHHRHRRWSSSGFSPPSIQFQRPSEFSPPPSYFSGHRRHHHRYRR